MESNMVRSLNLEERRARATTTNHERLVRYLAPLSFECDPNIDPIVFAGTISPQWRIVEFEYSALERNCPCGKTGITELCWIYNIHTHARPFVGNVCIEHFSDNEDVHRLAHMATLMNSGILVTVVEHRENERCYRLQLMSRHSTMYKTNPLARAYFGTTPLDETTLQFDAHYTDDFNVIMRPRSRFLVSMGMRVNRDDVDKSGVVYRLYAVRAYRAYDAIGYVIKVAVIDEDRLEVRVTNSNPEVDARIRLSFPDSSYNKRTKTWVITIPEADVGDSGPGYHMRDWLTSVQEELGQDPIPQLPDDVDDIDSNDDTPVGVRNLEIRKAVDVADEYKPPKKREREEDYCDDEVVDDDDDSPFSEEPDDVVDLDAISDVEDAESDADSDWEE